MKALVLLAMALASAIAGCLWYFAYWPLQGYSGSLPSITAEEREIAGRLATHVVRIASTPHNTDHPAELEAAAVYLEQQLAGLGYRVERQVFDADGQSVRNLHVTIGAPGARPSFVVGAHYDSFGPAPGANDNGTGTAALIELARLLKTFTPQRHRLRLVLFVNEEPPHFGRETQGSVQFARWLAAREAVAGMISLETLGAFSDQPGSQSLPLPVSLVYKDTANFIAFVGMPRARQLVHDTLASFRRHTAFPTIGGIGFAFTPGIAWSDHAAFDEQRIPALMITDTALFRYPHYHKPTDTPDKIDFDRLARITKGFERMIREVVD